jgi:hypothetical protein
MKSQISIKLRISSNMIVYKAFPIIFALISMLAPAQQTDQEAAQQTDQAAQEAKEAAQAEPAKKITGRKAWFLCTAIPDDLQNPVSVMIDENIHQVTLSIRHMSDPFPVRGEGIVKIVKEIPNPENADATIYQTLAQSQVPDHIQNALIILVPLPKNNSQKQVFGSKVINLNNFKGGDYLYLNLSPVQVGITLGENRSVLKPGETKIQENRDIANATNKMISLHYQSIKDEKWKLIVASTVVVQPTRREICIFHWDEKADRIDYRGATFPVEIE